MLLFVTYVDWFSKSAEPSFRQVRTVASSGPFGSGATTVRHALRERFVRMI